MIHYSLGLCDYAQVWGLQKQLARQVGERPEADECLLVVEHPEVVTIGRRFKGVTPTNAIAIERGGEATLHSPGQLVAYPILRLSTAERDLHGYLRKLEESIIRTVGDFGIEAIRKHGATGVWVDEGSKKIASIGVAVSRWITYHGIALNVSNDLRAFQQINPCGFGWLVMTSMERELGRPLTREAVEKSFCRNFEAVFHRQLDCRNPWELLSSLNEPLNG